MATIPHRSAPRVSHVQNAGPKRWSQTLASFAGRSGRANGRPPPFGFEPGVAAIRCRRFHQSAVVAAVVRAGASAAICHCSCLPKSVGGGILGLKSGTWCLPCVCVCVCVCVWKFFMRFLVFLLFLSDILRDKDSLSIMRGVSSTPAVGACRRLEHQHDCQ